MPETPPPETVHVNIGGMLAFVDDFSGDASSVSAARYFESIEEAALLGNWSPVHQAGIARLKLKGPAREFLEGETELKTANYATLKKAILECFARRDTSIARNSALLTCVQRPAETVQQYATRLKIVGRSTLITTQSEEENAVRKKVLEETLLGRFVEGLRGHFKRFVMHADPKTFKDAVELAEREEYYESMMGGSRHISAVQAPAPAKAVAKPPPQAPARFERARRETLPFAVCHRCGGRGHMVQTCPSPPIPAHWQSYEAPPNPRQWQQYEAPPNPRQWQYTPPQNQRSWQNFNAPPFNPRGNHPPQASNAGGQQHFGTGPTYRLPM